MKKTNKKGFTIVELVIVIAVIAILSAVLIPTFGGIINNANESNRNQVAKNAYTNYLIACEAQPDNNAYIVVTDDGKDYYYDIDNGQINLEKTVEVTIVCKVEGELKDYVIGYTAHTDSDSNNTCDVCKGSTN